MWAQSIEIWWKIWKFYILFETLKRNMKLNIKSKTPINYEMANWTKILMILERKTNKNCYEGRAFFFRVFFLRAIGMFFQRRRVEQIKFSISSFLAIYLCLTLNFSFYVSLPFIWIIRRKKYWAHSPKLPIDNSMWNSCEFEDAYQFNSCAMNLIWVVFFLIISF